MDDEFPLCSLYQYHEEQQLFHYFSIALNVAGYN
jgi:hypothetical protein